MESELERVARMCFEQSLGEMFPEERVALRFSDDDPPDYFFDGLFSHLVGAGSGRGADLCTVREERRRFQHRPNGAYQG